jgi:serine/threonine protein phosphatase PrpC
MGSRVVGDRTDGVVGEARSIGDFACPGVGHDPELNEVRLSDESRWMIVACDGVWDVFTEPMVARVTENAQSAQRLATDIRNLSFSLGSQDDISVIVVDLQPDEVIKRPE